MAADDANRFWADPSCASSSSTSTRPPAATGASSTSTTSRACARRTRRSSQATHALALSLVREGVVDGLRIDHPDGLADPARLPARGCATAGRSTCGSRRSSTPASSCATGRSTGTVGYEFLNDVLRAVRRPGRARRRSPRCGTSCPATRARSPRSPPRPSSSRRAGTFAPEVERLRRRRATCRRLEALARRWRRCRSTAPTSSPARRRGRRRPRRGGRRGRDARRRRASAAARAPRAGRVRHALPADDAAGDGQGRRGHRVLPLRAAAGAQRRRRRPRPLRDRRSTASTQANAERARRFPDATADDADPRHQALGRRAGADRRADRGCPSSGRSACGTGWRCPSRCAPAGAPDDAERYFMFQTLVGAWPIEPERLRALPGEGAARGQAQHELGRARTRSRRRRSAASSPALYDHAPLRRELRAVRRASWRSPASCIALRTVAAQAHRPRACPTSTRATSCPCRARGPRQPPAGRLAVERGDARTAGGRRPARAVDPQAVADQAAAGAAHPPARPRSAAATRR